MLLLKKMAVAIAAVLLIASPALADVTCVQQGLTDLGFDPGPVDGALGKKTVIAATLLATNAGLSLAPLTKSNSDEWCEAITKFAATPEAKTVSHLDLVSEPEGLLSDKKQQQMWDSYKSASECLTTPVYAYGVQEKLATVPVEAFATQDWQSPFTDVLGAPECTVDPGVIQAPVPMSKIVLDEAYGERVREADVAALWFRRLTHYLRFSGDPVAKQLLRETVVAWAKADALSKGTHVSWGKQPMDYQMMATLLSIMTPIAQLANEWTPDEKAIIGPWLNRRLVEVAGSTWLYRQDNKEYMTAYMAMLWGLIIGDDRPVQNAIFEYKLAIHDMRPDGSWPIDGQRGGMGVHYSSAAASQVVMIATLLKSARNIDLFGYEVDGRSVHTAIDWIVQAIKTPGASNKQYALSCPNSGDRFGSIEQPNESHLEEAGYLVAFAEQFPERESSKFILDYYKDKPMVENERNGGAPQCLFATTGGKVNLPPLVMPEPLPELPAAKLFVHLSDVLVLGEDPMIHTLLNVDVEGAPDGEGYIGLKLKGPYSEASRNFVSLDITVNSPVDGSTDDLEKCGINIDTYDDGRKYAILSFAVKGDMLSIDNPDCVIEAMPKPAARMASFAVNSLQDLAIGLTVDGTINSLSSPMLSEFLTRVAMGEITIKRE